MSASICLYSHYAYSYYYYYAASQYYVDEWSVGLSVTVVSPAKTAEPIDIVMSCMRVCRKTGSV